MLWLDRCNSISTRFQTHSKRGRLFYEKGGYAVHGLIICDDTAKITSVEMGWSGSVHDNRVWSNSDVNLNKKKYFTNREYLLGDSAFSASSIMIPAYKKEHNVPLSEEKEYFNTKLAKIRIKSQRLKGQRRVIKAKEDLDHILRLNMCACILHNLLIDHPAPQQWFESEQDEKDELNQAVQSTRRGDTRRSQMFAYMLEIR